MGQIPRWYTMGVYRNTPHDTTGEKPSFLLFGTDLRTPTEATFLPLSSVNPTDVDDYREELMLSLSRAREIATQSIQKSQKQYKKHYDAKATSTKFKVGQWVLVRFPQEESGRQRKLSRPWHGPYRIISRDDPNLTVQKVYFPGGGPIQIHQSRVTRCPLKFPAGYYWYGNKRKGPGRPPKWVDDLLTTGNDEEPCQSKTDELETDVESQLEEPEEPEVKNSDPELMPEVENESMPARTGTERYGLRRCVSPPKKLMQIDTSARDELVREGGVM